ncbi:MAG: glycosyltransferase [Proteobacteria bacterium]|nr:glycosyltransferase [Pseudomonadota bacterium]
MNAPARRPLRILFVFRAPVGGLFRNVYDVVKELAQRGHQIGIFCDSMTGGPRGEQLLAELKPMLALGLHRTPMRRPPHPADVVPLYKTARLIRELKPDIVQGEGAKGGLYARFEGFFAPKSGPIRCYTPHGGSLNYKPGSLSHRVFMGIEWLLERGTDLFLFESVFVRDRFAEFVCHTNKTRVVALNGLHPEEYQPYACREDATDFFYVGEFREAKGLDTLMEAMALLGRSGLRPSLTMIGGGPDEGMIRRLANGYGLDGQVTWLGVRPAREALTMGRIMVLPSRFESLPYVILEAVGGCVPLISTDVGGIREILPQESLIPANDPQALADAMRKTLARDYEDVKREAAERSEAIRQRFTVEQMVNTIEDAYYAALGARGRV